MESQLDNLPTWSSSTPFSPLDWNPLPYVLGPGPESGVRSVGGFIAPPEADTPLARINLQAQKRAADRDKMQAHAERHRHWQDRYRTGTQLGPRILDPERPVRRLHSNVTVSRLRIDSNALRRPSPPRVRMVVYPSERPTLRRWIDCCVRFSGGSMSTD